MSPSDPSPATLRQLAEQFDEARRAIDWLRDAARESGRDFRLRDKAVMTLHRALDQCAARLAQEAQELSPLLDESPELAYRQGREDARRQEPSWDYALVCLQADRHVLTLQLQQATARWQALREFVEREQDTAADEELPALERVQAEMTRLDAEGRT